MNNKWKWLSFFLLSYILLFSMGTFKWVIASLIFVAFLFGDWGTWLGFSLFIIGLFVGIVCSRAFIEWILNKTHKEAEDDLH